MNSRKRTWQDIIGANRPKSVLAMLASSKVSVESCPWEFIFILSNEGSTSDILFHEHDGRLCEYKDKFTLDAKKPYLILCCPRDQRAYERQIQPKWLERVLGFQHADFPSAFFAAAQRGNVYQFTTNPSWMCEVSIDTLMTPPFKARKLLGEVEFRAKKENFHSALSALEAELKTPEDQREPTNASHPAQGSFDTIRSCAETYFSTPTQEHYSSFNIFFQAQIPEIKIKLAQHQRLNIFQRFLLFGKTPVDPLIAAVQELDQSQRSSVLNWN